MDRLHPFHWDTVYALHTDYITTARAADACSAHFTALIYIEHWCERRYGCVALPRNAAIAPTAADHMAGASGGPRAPSVGAPSILARLLPGATQSQAPPGQQRQQQPKGRRQQQQQQRGSRSATPAAIPNGGASDSSDADEARLSEVEALLLGLYDHIKDPDGVYAIAAVFGSSRARLQLQQHEGRWAEVLAATDEQLQHPAARGAGAAAGGDAAAGSVGTGQADLLRALERMGCRHTAQKYLAGAATGMEQAATSGGGGLGECGTGGTELCSGGGSEQLREVQAQLAWRLGDWGEPSTSTATAAATATGSERAGRSFYRDGSSSSVDGGFHTAVLRSLQLLRSGDGEAFQATLSAARHAAVSALASSGDESAITINRSLVRNAGCAGGEGSGLSMDFMSSL